MAVCRRDGVGEQHYDAQGGDLLLVDDSLLEHPGYSTWGLDFRGYRVRRGRVSLCWADCCRWGLYYFTKISRTLLFWTAFILTRPLGATLGDLLTKPNGEGGLNLSRFVSTAVIAVFMMACILLIPQRPGSHPGQQE